MGNYQSEDTPNEASNVFQWNELSERLYKLSNVALKPFHSKSVWAKGIRSIAKQKLTKKCKI